MKKLAAVILLVSLMANTVFAGEGLPSQSGKEVKPPKQSAQKSPVVYKSDNVSKILHGVYIFFYLNSGKNNYVDIKVNRLSKDKSRNYKILGNNEKYFEDSKYSTFKKECVNFFSGLPRGFDILELKSGRIQWGRIIKKRYFSFLNNEALFLIIGNQVQKYINELEAKSGSVVRLDSSALLDISKKIKDFFIGIGCSDMVGNEFQTVILDNKEKKYLMCDYIKNINIVDDDTSSSTIVDFLYF